MIDEAHITSDCVLFNNEIEIAEVGKLVERIADIYRNRLAHTLLDADSNWCSGECDWSGDESCE